jgi:hypothetical protein
MLSQPITKFSTFTEPGCLPSHLSTVNTSACSSNNRFNVILQFTPRSLKQRHPFRCLNRIVKLNSHDVLRAKCSALLSRLQACVHTYFLMAVSEEYKLRSSKLCTFHSLVIWLFVGPNILLSTLFSNIHNLSFSLNVRDQISHPYKTIGIIIDLCTVRLPVTVAERSKAWTVFALGRWDRGFESHTRHGCLVYVFILWLYCLVFR